MVEEETDRDEGVTAAALAPGGVVFVGVGDGTASPDFSVVILFFAAAVVVAAGFPPRDFCTKKPPLHKILLLVHRVCWAE